MNNRHDNDIFGDGHGFRNVSQGGPPSALPSNPPGIYTVCVYDLEGKRMTSHPCDGTYDSRRLALNAVVDACSRNSRDVGHVDWHNNGDKPAPSRYNYNMAEAPEISTRILGLYKLHAPGTEKGWIYHTRVVWLAKPLEHGCKVPDHPYRYLTDERSEMPYFIEDPIAWALTPEP